MATHIADVAIGKALAKNTTFKEDLDLFGRLASLCAVQGERLAAAKAAEEGHE